MNDLEIQQMIAGQRIFQNNTLCNSSQWSRTTQLWSLPKYAQSFQFQQYQNLKHYFKQENDKLNVNKQSQKQPYYTAPSSVTAGSPSDDSDSELIRLKIQLEELEKENFSKLSDPQNRHLIQTQVENFEFLSTYFKYPQVFDAFKDKIHTRLKFAQEVLEKMNHSFTETAQRQIRNVLDKTLEEKISISLVNMYSEQDNKSGYLEAEFVLRNLKNFYLEELDIAYALSGGDDSDSADKKKSDEQRISSLKAKLFRNYISLGTMQVKLDALEGAWQSFNHALQFGDSSLVRQHMGMVSYRQKNLTLAYQQLLKADSLLDAEFATEEQKKKSWDFSNQKANVKRQISLLYQEQGQIETANDFAKQQLSHLEQAYDKITSLSTTLASKEQKQRDELKKEIIHVSKHIAQNLLNIDKSNTPVEAMQLLDKTLELERKHGSHVAAAELLSLRAQAQKLCEQHSDAIDSYQECLKVLFAQKYEYDNIAAVYVNMGLEYAELKNFTSAQDTFDLIQNEKVVNPLVLKLKDQAILKLEALRTQHIK